ncbi:MAG: hypothetical protein KQI78_12150 [Deltaproteobacteria bacterium]|nr:hypothetical protein [Deltaproteobacteria bacterium]
MTNTIDRRIRNIRCVNEKTELQIIAELQPQIESATRFFMSQNMPLLQRLGLDIYSYKTQQVYKNYADEILLTAILTDFASVVRFFNGDRAEHIQARYLTTAPYLTGNRGTRASRDIDHYLFLNSKTIIDDISRLKGFGFDDTEAVLGALDRPGGCGYTPDFYRTRAQGMMDRFEILQRTHPDYDGTHLLIDARKYLKRDHQFCSDPITKLFTGTQSVLYQRLLALVRFEIREYNGRVQTDLMNTGTRAVEVDNYGPDGDGYEDKSTNDFIDIVNPHALYQDNEDRWQEFINENGKQFCAGLKPKLQEFYAEAVLERGERKDIMTRMGVSPATFKRRIKDLREAYQTYCLGVGWDTTVPKYTHPTDGFDDLKHDAKEKLKEHKGQGINCPHCDSNFHKMFLNDFNECPVCGKEAL